MRISTQVSRMNVQDPSKATGAQEVGSTSFQARLVPVASGRSSVPEAGPTGAEILQQAAQEMRSLLRLQYELSRRTTSLVSNILKTRHETAKNSIQNIR
ncbi:MAG TPA: hypothetical protein VEU33_15150 [Archangium sp.]|nr:hypothetical protein [Archangium sp.]